MTTTNTTIRTTTPTILTIPSTNGILDGNYLRNILTATTILSSPNDVVIEESSHDDKCDKNDVTSSSTTSLWILPLNTIIIFLSANTGNSDTKLIHQQSTGATGTTAVAATAATTTTTNTVVWTVPAILVQELLRSNSSSDHSMETAVLDHNEYIIRFPSSSSYNLMILPDTISLHSSHLRSTMIQKIIRFGDNSVQRPQLPYQQQQPDLVDIPLEKVTPQKNPLDDTAVTNTVTAVTTKTQNCVIVEHLPKTVAPNVEKPSIFPSLESKILTLVVDPQQQQPSSSSSEVVEEGPSSPLLPTKSTTALAYQPFTLNSQQPIPFETDLFRGQLLLICKPSHDPATTDPYWYERIFKTKKRRCILTVQGRFKSIPQGIVYAGAEVSQPMKLGLVIKGICTILLKLVERFNSNIHSSFGTTTTTTTNNNNNNPKKEEDNYEVAHIVAPAYTFYERLVVTSPNERPPSILEEIIESSESIQLRKSSTSISSQPKIWNTTDTYTFSFYSMYIDLPTWQLVGLPASGDIGLQTFWGSSLLRICMYDKTNDASLSQQKQQLHIQSKNRYAFSIQLEYLGKNGEKKKQQQQLQNTVESPKSSKISDDSIISENSDRGGAMNRNDIFHTDRRLRNNLIQHPSFQGMRRSESQLFLHEMSSCDESTDEIDGDNEELPFFDARESHLSFPDENTDSSTNNTLNSLASSPIPEVDTKLLHNLSIIDQNCPYWIELCTPSRNGSSFQYMTAFACSIKFKSTLVTTFRLESECENLLNGTGDNSTPISADLTIVGAMQRFSSRISSLERIRRFVGLALSDGEGTAISKSSRMTTFRGDSSSTNTYDNEFLSSTKMQPSTSNAVRWSGYIARAYSDRHWVEEWVCRYEVHITFRHLERRKSSEFVLLISNIIGVEKLNQDACPYNTKYSILAVSTLTNTVYLMFSSVEALESWCEMIDPSLLQEPLIKKLSNEVNSNVIDSIGAAADDLLHKSSVWNCKNRRLLNCASYCFRVDSTTAESLNPLLLAEGALRQATEITNGGVENCTEKQLYDFMRSAAMLKQAYVSGLDESSRLAFYLNVYHVMISHAYLVLGPPDSSLKWINYFNNIAYQVGDDIFSLTELEHSIIRANMSYPTQFLSRFIIPKSAYPSHALTISDCRINFALNCGSLSNPSKIILYQPPTLNQQLDDASRLYLLSSATYRRTGSGDLELKLPRICQWFADDFGPTRQDLLSTVEPYLPLDIQRQLDGCRLTTTTTTGKEKATLRNRFDMSSIIIRYHSYNFECRPLSIL